VTGTLKTYFFFSERCNADIGERVSECTMNKIATSSRRYFWLSKVSMNWANRGPAHWLKFFFFFVRKSQVG